LQKNLKVLLVFCLLVGLTFVLTGCPQTQVRQNGNDTAKERAEEKQEPQPGGEAPEEEANFTKYTDQAPDGCASCHRKVSEEKDYRLSAETENIEGHPDVPENAEINDCIQCHGTDSKRPFARILHRVHIVEGDHYREKYDKTCINCHRVADNGVVTIKGLQSTDTETDDNPETNTGEGQ